VELATPEYIVLFYTDDPSVYTLRGAKICAKKSPLLKNMGRLN
jgi:hypothetical protein